MKRLRKKRVIFDNYNTENMYDYAKETLLENNEEGYEPSENAIWEEVSEQLSIQWDDEKAALESFFEGKTLILIGSFGHWTGPKGVGEVSKSIRSLISKSISDCDYWKIWDENGHLFIDSFHHDGNNHYEIKILSDQGVRYFENWENGNDNRKPMEVLNRAFYKYATLPRFAENAYGCPRVEYEKESV